MASPETRVLLVTPDFPPAKGGIQLLLERLIENAPGLRTRVLTLGQEGATEFDRDAGLDVRRVARADGDRRIAALRLNAQTLREAATFRPDVILSGHVVASLAAISLRRALRTPFVQYVHADEFRVRARLSAAAVRRADATIAVSAYTREMALAAGARPERVNVIHPGVDLPAAVPAAREEEPTLLTVATLLFRYKGHDVMTRALPLIRAQVPEARWIVVGDGPFRPAIESAIEAYGLGGSVELLGRVSDSERNEWLDRASVFCMPSRLPADGLGGEGFGIVYLEAAAHGMPSLGGNVAGARDAVLDGETGLLVDPTDHLALAAAATRLLAEPELARKMGAAARRHAEAHAWPLIAAKVEALLHEVASGRVPPAV
ncbi:MAG TPA: glycosyltransferase family 4 protein [Solirubrobacterales bacterium]|nr:glycosyltransferase family 4 protein [Solirubrobacterales bacterium]